MKLREGGPGTGFWLKAGRCARGGDLDLMLELSEPAANPALLAARFSARVTRLIQGRKVDVLLAAPNLKRLSIHDIAFKEGKVL
jgi:hypothetical protein